MEAKKNVTKLLLQMPTHPTQWSEQQVREFAEISFKAGYEQGGLDSYSTDFAEGKRTGIKEVVELSDELLEIGRKAIEDVLVEWRDNRLSEFTRGNGLVIREKDGKDSSIIRFGPETALKIGMRAIGETKLKEWGV